MNTLWDLHKKVRGDWYKVTSPKTVTLEMESPGERSISVSPSASPSWTTTVDNSELQRVLQPVAGRRRDGGFWPTPITARGPGGGNYGFRVLGSSLWMVHDR